MKRKNTLWSLVLALVMVLGVFAPLSTLAAQPTTEKKDITVNVHKILISKDALKAHDVNKTYKPSEGIANIAEFFGDKDAKEIEGVYFVALKEGHANYDDFESLTKEQQKTVVDAVPDTMKGLTKANGQLALTLESPGKYKIYEVKSMSTYDKATEQDKKVLAEQKAVPVKLDLPDHARTENGIADAIHVYPKNTEDKPTVDKFVVKDGKDVKEATFDKDEEHTWAIPATIPTGFKDYEVFKLTDVIDARLSYKKDQEVKVTVPDKADITLEKDKDYKVTAPTEEKGGTLIIEFTKAGIQKLAAAEGLKVRAEFVTTINEDADMSVNIPNDVTLEYGHNPNSTGKTKPGEKPRVYTGGKKFVKIDSTKTGDERNLKGAEFVVKNSKGEFLFEVDGKYEWKAIENATPEKIKEGIEGPTPGTKLIPKILTSGEDGTFEIKGLKYERPNGTKYELVEVKAPDKYALKDDPIEFTVDDKSYNTVNELHDAITGTADPQEVDNKPLTIPQTGGMGTMIFMVAGLALMGGAFIAMRKRSAEQA